MDFDIEYTETDKEKINKMAGLIDIKDYSLISKYGLPAQNKIVKISNKILTQSNAYNTDEITEPLNVLLEEFKAEDSKVSFFTSLFKEEELKTYDVELFDIRSKEVISTLEEQLVEIKKVNFLLEDLKKACIDGYKELSMFIESGNISLANLKESDHNLEVFKKRLETLEISRVICTQTYAQIELIQYSNQKMDAKIQETILNTIPLWRSQIVIANTVNNSKELEKIQNKVKKELIDLVNENVEKVRKITKNKKEVN